MDHLTGALQVLVLDLDQPLALVQERLGAGDEGGRRLAAVLVQPLGQPRQPAVAHLQFPGNEIRNFSNIYRY